MNNKRIPVYVICASNQAEQSLFLTQYCQHKRPLWIDVSSVARTQTDKPNMPWLDAHLSPEAAGSQLAAWVQQAQADSLWLQWSDSQPISWLLMITQSNTFEKQCKLHKIVRVGEAQAEYALLTHPSQELQDQLSQCDLYVIHDGDRAQLAKLRRAATVLQPDLAVVPAKRSRDIASELSSKNLLQPLRFTMVLVLSILVLALLPRFSFSISSAVATFLGTFLQALPFLMLGIFLSSINGKASVALWRGKVAEYKLGEPVGFTVPPDLCDILHALIHLAARIIRQRGIDNPLVKP